MEESRDVISSHIGYHIYYTVIWLAACPISDLFVKGEPILGKA